MCPTGTQLCSLLGSSAAPQLKAERVKEQRVVVFFFLFFFQPWTKFGARAQTKAKDLRQEWGMALWKNVSY